MPVPSPAARPWGGRNRREPEGMLMWRLAAGNPPVLLLLGSCPWGVSMCGASIQVRRTLASSSFCGNKPPAGPPVHLRNLRCHLRPQAPRSPGRVQARCCRGRKDPVGMHDAWRGGRPAGESFIDMASPTLIHTPDSPRFRVPACANPLRGFNLRPLDGPVAQMDRARVS